MCFLDSSLVQIDKEDSQVKTTIYLVRLVSCSTRQPLY